MADAHRIFKRAKLGDPDFDDGMQEYQAFMLRQSTVDIIRRRILDTQTHNVSEYNPDALLSSFLAVPYLARRSWSVAGFSFVAVSGNSLLLKFMLVEAGVVCASI